MNTNSSLPQIDGGFFTWSNANGVAHLSDIPLLLGDRFTVTGRTRSVEFSQSSSFYSPEGELECIDFRSKCGKFHVTLFND